MDECFVWCYCVVKMFGDFMLVVELCVSVLQLFGGIVVDDCKDFVCSCFLCWVGVDVCCDVCVQLVCYGIGVGGEFQLQIVFEIGFELGCDKVGFGEELG